MRIVRRLFVVPLANNNHGKTTMIEGLVAQGLGAPLKGVRKGRKTLTTPYGRAVDALIFGRSYQETEKSAYGSVEAALDAADSNWRARELIIMPSHVSNIGNDINEMIEAAHGAGFDIVCAAVDFANSIARHQKTLAQIWLENWDARWTIPNQEKVQSIGQLDALGRDLWFWISRTLTV